MEAIAQRPAAQNRMASSVLIILAIVALWVFTPISRATIVLVGVTILFFFGLKKPVWALAALLVSQFTVTSYIIETPLGVDISLRLTILILTLLLLWQSFAQKKVELGPGAKRIIIPAVVFTVLLVASDLIYTDFNFAFKDFRSMVSGLLIIPVFMAAATRSLKDLKTLCAVALIMVSASAFIGILQHYQFLGLGTMTLFPIPPEQMVDGQFRVPGMAETELELAFTLPVSIAVVLGVFLARGTDRRYRWLTAISALVMGLALYFTYTRSGLFALVLGLAALFLFLKTRIRGEIILGAALVGIIIIEATGVFSSIYVSGRNQSLQDESSSEREILWQASLAIVKDYPILGIGGNQFTILSPQYSWAVDPALIKQQEEYWSYRTLGNQKPHNDFLMIWVSYGTIALAVYIWFFFSVLRNCLNSARTTNKRFVRGLAIGLAAGLVSYTANSFYHNLLAGMPLLWIIAGFSVALAKFSSDDKSLSKPKQINTKQSG
jgi:O-antigen ligase